MLILNVVAANGKGSNAKNGFKPELTSPCVAVAIPLWQSEWQWLLAIPQKQHSVNALGLKQQNGKHIFSAVLLEIGPIHACQYIHVI
jgi:hypothetical protein